MRTVKTRWVNTRIDQYIHYWLMKDKSEKTDFHWTVENTQQYCWVPWGSTALLVSQLAPFEQGHYSKPCTREHPMAKALPAQECHILVTLFSQLSALFINCPLIANPAPAMDTSSCQMLECISEGAIPCFRPLCWTLWLKSFPGFLRASLGCHEQAEQASRIAFQWT